MRLYFILGCKREDGREVETGYWGWWGWVPGEEMWRRKGRAGK
jgi:hypothetical protein